MTKKKPSDQRILIHSREPSQRVMKSGPGITPCTIIEEYKGSLDRIEKLKASKGETMIKDLVIWWLDQADCEAIGRDLPSFPPAYLMEQYRDRFGRPGRGRLWTDPMFGSVAVDPWPTTSLSKRLDLCGGIVMRAEHLSHIEQLPGIVTDFQLHRPCALVTK